MLGNGLEKSDVPEAVNTDRSVVGVVVVVEIPRKRLHSLCGPVTRRV